jgi:molybdopterin adenylyltransferase|tara:strand:+ start:2464 stop:3039 length:576 start_codon:yes stop_codon:yes gene_type:complete
VKERFIKIGLISISDRAASGEYIDKGLPNLKSWLNKVLVKPFSLEENIIPDEIEIIKNTLKELSDKKNCDLILTTGGTGPAKRDVTPEATLSIGDKEMPGFGEQMRQISLNFVPTAILSRQVAVIRNKTLIINLPGQPKAIEETLEGVKNKKGDLLIPGIFAAVPYCLDLIGAPYIETKDTILKSFRPKKK